MALQTSGAISLNEIHIEAGGSTGTSATINDQDIRDMISKASGVQMSFSEWYGASSGFSMTYGHTHFMGDDASRSNNNHPRKMHMRSVIGHTITNDPGTDGQPTWGSIYSDHVYAVYMAGAANIFAVWKFNRNDITTAPTLLRKFTMNTGVVSYYLSIIGETEDNLVIFHSRESHYDHAYLALSKSTGAVTWKKMVDGHQETNDLRYNNSYVDGDSLYVWFPKTNTTGRSIMGSYDIDTGNVNWHREAVCIFQTHDRLMPYSSTHLQLSTKYLKASADKNTGDGVGEQLFAGGVLNLEGRDIFNVLINKSTGAWSDMLRWNNPQPISNPTGGCAAGHTFMRTTGGQKAVCMYLKENDTVKYTAFQWIFYDSNNNIQFMKGGAHAALSISNFRVAPFGDRFLYTNRFMSVANGPTASDGRPTNEQEIYVGVGNTGSSPSQTLSWSRRIVPTGHGYYYTGTSQIHLYELETNMFQFQPDSAGRFNLNFVNSNPDGTDEDTFGWANYVFDPDTAPTTGTTGSVTLYSSSTDLGNWDWVWDESIFGNVDESFTYDTTTASPPYEDSSNYEGTISTHTGYTVNTASLTFPNASTSGITQSTSHTFASGDNYRYKGTW